MQDTIILIFIILCGMSFIALLIVKFALWINRFEGELKYINTEIRRSTGNEKKHWKKERRKLWFSAFSFKN